jgi:hypothetical protein
MKRRWFSSALALLLIALAVIALVWASDRITLQGERTIYAVECAEGAWEGSRCTGRLVAGPRYAFRVSTRRHEVLHWIRGSGAPSLRFTGCEVKDRDNWSCAADPGQPPMIAYGMRDGRPLRPGDTAIGPFHDVSKWKWWAIRYGVNFFSEALE